MRFLFKRLGRDARGVTIVEFAIVCPIMLLLMMGLSELAFQSYLQAILTGAVQKAARDSTIDGNGTADANAAIDNKVKYMIGSVIKNAAWDASSRENYSHFADIGPEYFFDSNGNGKYDKGECFIDSNGNGTWDADPGSSGQGGANAVVVYQIGFSYPRLFPLARMLGWPSTVHITAKTILKNQPYTYTANADDAKVCS